MTVAALSLLLTAPAARAAEPAPSISLPTILADPHWTITDIDGQKSQPWSSRDTRAVVLVFIGTDCPVSNYYQPTLRTLQQQFQDPAVKWYYIHTDAQLTRDRAALHRQDYSITTPIAFDPQHTLARTVGATRLPQAAVLTRDGSIAYLGRIDDTYAGFGKKRARPSRLDLHAALTDILAGRPVATPRTDSVGCFIPFAKTN